MRDEVAACLAELRRAVEAARSVPMSASVMIHRTEFNDLLDRLQKAVHAALAEADAVVDERQAVVDSGRDQAEEIVRQAERQRDDLVSDTGVFTVASARAEEMVVEAEQASQELKDEADAYVEQHLADFEITLEAILETVRRGRSRLTHGHVHGLSDDTDVADIALPDHLEP